MDPVHFTGEVRHPVPLAAVGDRENTKIDCFKCSKKHVPLKNSTRPLKAPKKTGKRPRSRYAILHPTVACSRVGDAEFSLFTNYDARTLGPLIKGAKCSQRIKTALTKALRHQAFIRPRPCFGRFRASLSAFADRRNRADGVPRAGVFPTICSPHRDIPRSSPGG